MQWFVNGILFGVMQPQDQCFLEADPIKFLVN